MDLPPKPSRGKKRSKVKKEESETGEEEEEESDEDIEDEDETSAITKAILKKFPDYGTAVYLIDELKK